MSRSYQSALGGYVVETGARSYQRAFGGYLIETQTGGGGGGSTFNENVDETATISAAHDGTGIFAVAANESGGVGDAIALMQMLSPAADVTAGNWTPSTGATLYGVVDEATEDDADYMQSGISPTADVCEIKLAAGTPPQGSGPHFISYALSQVGGASSCVVSLYCGTTLIATWTHATLPDSPTYARFDQSLTSAQIAAISDYTDLRLRFSAS